MDAMEFGLVQETSSTAARMGLNPFARRFVIGGLAAALLATTPWSSSKANEHVWIPSGQPAVWSSVGRWSPSGPPANGDSIRFVANGASLTSTNDLVGRSLTKVHYGSTRLSTTIAGNQFILTGVGGTDNLGLINNSPSTMTISAPIKLNGTIGFSTVGNVDLTGGMSGTNSSDGIIKVGAGTLIMNGTNTFTGDATVKEGTLQLGTGDALSDGTTVVLSPNAILDLAGTAERFGGLSGTGGKVDLNGGGNMITGVNNASTTFSGNIDGNGSIEKRGTGTLILAGTNTYSEGTTVTGGTLQGNATSLQGDIVNNANVTFNQTSTGTYAGVVSGSGTVTKTGSSTLFFDGTNTYTGGTIVSSGTLDIDKDSNLGNAAGTLTLTSARLQTNNTFSTSRTTTLNTYGIFKVNDGQICIFNSCSPTTETLTHNGEITGTGNLYKDGNSVLQLGGSANTNSGTTYVRDGTLRLTANNQLSDSDDLFVYDGAQFDLNDRSEIIRGLETTDSSSNPAIPFGTVDLGAGQLTVNTAGTTATFSGVISGADGKLKKEGAGTQILNGANTYTGYTWVTGGTVQMGSGSSLSSQSDLYVYSGGTFDLNDQSIAVDLFGNASSTGTVDLGSGTLTIGSQGSGGDFDGVIEGTGSLIKTGAGTQILSGANTYTGRTRIAGGTLQLGASDVISDSSEGVYISAGALFDLNDNDETVQFLKSWNGASGDGGSVDLGSGNLTINNTGWTGTTFYGVISGAGSVTIDGNFSQTFLGSNTYTGGTIIQDGTLILGASEVLADGGTPFARGVDFRGSGNLNLNGHTETVNWVQTLAGPGGGINLGTNGDLIINGNFTGLADFRGVISGTGDFTKNGSGHQRLSGANTFTGETRINDGTLSLGASEVLGTLAFGAGGVYMSGDAILDLNSHTETVQWLHTTSGTDAQVQLDSGSLIINGGFTGTAKFTGDISGTGGSLTKNGSGLQVLTGNNTYTGGTTINGGTLAFQSASNLGSGGLTFDNGATLRLNDTPSFSTLVTVSDDIQLNGNSSSGGGTFDVATSTSTEYLRLNGKISGSGALQKRGAGILYLSNSTNDYTGRTRIFDGTLALIESNSIGDSGVYVSDGALLDLRFYSDTVKWLHSADGATGDGGSVNLGNGSLTLSTGGGANFYGVISGTGSLTMAGLGTQTLSGANTFTGLTTVSSGTLRIGAGAGDALVGGLVVDGGTFDLGVDNERVASVQLLSGTITGTGTAFLSTDAANFDLQSGTVSAVLDGNSGVIKSGAGTVTLTKANTFTGLTTVAGGTLRIAAGAGNALVGGLVVNGGTFDLGADNEDVASVQLVSGSIIGSGKLESIDGNFDLRSGTVSAVLGGGSTVTKSTSGTVTLSGVNTYSGDTTINGGTIQISSNDGLGTGSLIMNGGTLRISNNDVTMTRTATLNGGNISGGGTFEVDGSRTLTLNGKVAGNGQLVKTGAGILALGNNTSDYTGFTRIQDGTLRLDTNNGLSAATHVWLTSDATFDVNGKTATVGALHTEGAPGNGGFVKLGNGSLTIDWSGSGPHFRGVISGTGSITKNGIGTQVFSGANTYTGLTLINDGTLRLAGNGSISESSGVHITGNGIFDVNSVDTTVKSISGTGEITLGNAALTVNRAGSAVYNGDISGVGGSMIFGGTGNMHIRGNNTYTGGTTFKDGTVLVLNDGNLGDATGTLTFDGGKLETQLAFNMNRETFLNSTGGTIQVDTGNVTQSGDMKDGTGAGKLTKSGGGTLTLAGNNTYTGDTNVDQGVLALSGNGAFDSAKVAIASGARLDLSGRTSLDPFSANMVNSGTVDGSDLISQTLSGDFENQGTVDGKVGGFILSGDVNGAGNYLGDVTFAGSFDVGNSPALVTGETMTFASTNTLLMEVGGFNRGSEYDAINALKVTLDGALNISLINSFMPSMIGQKFDLIVADMIVGNFSSFSFASLTEGLTFRTRLLVDEFGDDIFQLVVRSSEAGVPGPGAIFILVFGLAGFTGLRRRRV